VAVLIVVIATFLAFGGGVPWSSDYELKAQVASGLELQSRSPVRIAGVEVGRVKKVERGPGNTAIVTMTIKDVGLPIHRDATLKIRPRIFLEGNFFVDLKPGTPNAPTLGSGSTLPLAQTTVPVQLDEILSSLQSGTRENLKALVHGFATGVEGGGGQSLRRGLPEWGPAFTNTAVAAEAARGLRPDDLSKFIAGSEKTAAALASRDHQLVQLLDGLTRTVTALASRRAQLEASMPQLAALLGEAPPALRSIDAALPPTRALAIEVRPALREAPSTLRLARPVLAQARALVAPGELPALLGQLDPALADLAPLEPQLTALFQRLRPITECVRRNALPTLRTPIDDPPLNSGDPPYRELLHGFVGLSSASQNFDANGPAVRYHAGFGDQLVSFGSVPTVGEPLVGLTSEPLIGSRPKPPARQPPFRPDVACATQSPPNLAAQTGPAPAQRKVALKRVTP
ncbi:MAG: phospholipid/cholesterol/gamma-HCH transport system substrate-binding protein, partial [Thermoleophilaceae bacterium]|nr:phospholipid/cholesterol/gamma-HCH transport system substrate-binding protein [Thermoleophilaceae bacterium]